MKDKFSILCCENIRPEVEAVLATGALPRATVSSFPFHCGHIRSVWKTVSEPYHELERTGARVCLCACGCSNTLDIPPEIRAGSTLDVKGAGASLFLPKDLVTGYQKNGIMLVLPGLLARWKKNADCDGLDQATARQMYGESSREILFLDTGTHPGTTRMLEEFSAFTGIPARVLPVGLEHFRLLLMESYLTWQYETEVTGCRTRVRASEKKVADYSMVADLTTRIIGAHEEKTVILQMLDLFIVLCSPKRAGFLPFRNGIAGEIISIPSEAYVPENGQPPVPDPVSQYRISGTGDGFQFRVMYNSDLIGILSIDSVSLPEYLDDYLNLTHFISQIAGLSITIARTYQDLEKALAVRDSEITERKRAEDALQMAIKKLNMLSSITRHDIRNQLMGLRGYLALTKRKIEDLGSLEMIQKADKASESIQWQIEFTRNYQDIGAQAPKWQRVSDIISSAVRQLNPPGIEIAVAVREWEIFADPLLEKVFYNLMENSLRHGEHVSRMNVSAEESDTGLILIYSDNGVGISSEDKKRLFQKGFGKHTGLGLFLSREILAITGITINENGEPGTGVRFEMTVPKGAYRSIS